MNFTGVVSIDPPLRQKCFSLTDFVKTSFFLKSEMQKYENFLLFIVIFKKLDFPISFY